MSDQEEVEGLYNRIEDQFPNFPDIRDKFDFVFSLMGDFRLSGSIVNTGTQRLIQKLWVEHESRRIDQARL